MSQHPQAPRPHGAPHVQTIDGFPHWILGPHGLVRVDGISLRLNTGMGGAPFTAGAVDLSQPLQPVGVVIVWEVLIPRFRQGMTTQRLQLDTNASPNEAMAATDERFPLPEWRS